MGTHDHEQVVRDTANGYELSYVHRSTVYHKEIDRVRDGLKFSDSKMEFPSFVDIYFLEKRS